MKFRTTKKAINAGYGTRIEIGYADLQNLLKYKNAVAYTTRPEGWGADIYDFGNVAIVTGYAPFGNFRPDYDMVHRYDEAAEKAFEVARAKFLPAPSGYYAWENYNAECKARCEALLDRFITKCLNMKWHKGVDDGGI